MNNKKIIILFALISFIIFLLLYNKNDQDSNENINYEYEIKYSYSKYEKNTNKKDILDSIKKRISIIDEFKYDIELSDNYFIIKTNKRISQDVLDSLLITEGELSFRNSSDELIMNSEVLKSNGVKVVSDDKAAGYYYIDLQIKDVDTFHEKTEVIRKSGDVLVIWLDFEEGKDKFVNEREKCGSLNNSRCISYASINRELTGTHVSLTGNFTKAEAEWIANIINSSKLPIKITR